MEKIGLIANTEKPQAVDRLNQVCDWLAERNYEYWLDENTAELIEREVNYKFYNSLVEEVDVIIVFGGDGTFLKAARTFVDSDIPILGINLGNLGFLTDIEVERLEEGLEKLVSGDYKIEDRMTLEGKIIRDGEVINRVVAINDLVVTKGPFSRIIKLDTFIDDEYLATYPGDGLIVACPTGSTAYSLSAGGPIVNPKLNSLIITPICPHTLHSRSIIATEDEEVKVEIKADHTDVMLTVDGQDSFSVKPSDVIKINKAEALTKLIKLNNYNFYQILRDRLQRSEF
ncbi:MAG: NAD(+)/NADH kinase [Bacillota bacterium]